jgi:hypothetical protein
MECCPTVFQCLCEVAGYWWELEHTVIHVDPDHPKRDQWVRMLAPEELEHFQLPVIVYRSLRHGAVHYHAETGGDDAGWTYCQIPQNNVGGGLW